MQVVIDGKPVRFDPQDVLGRGGEATVMKLGNMAVKVYHDPTPERGKKLQDFIPRAALLPSEVVAPKSAVFDARGRKVVGFTMDLLPQGFVPVGNIRNKTWRDRHDITTQQVIRLFEGMHRTLNAVHGANVVVGDFNDQNVLFAAERHAFIDTDSFQFDTYPCLVATEAYLEPTLYGMDLSERPVFRPEHDWYSYAVMLFYTLFMIHPYGGVHPVVRDRLKRASSHLFVFQPEVVYPKTKVINPDVVTDELLQVFWEIFNKGKRMIFPIQQLEELERLLVKCNSCDTWYAGSRQNCPQCSERNLVLVQLKKAVHVPGTVACDEVLVTKGKIVFFRVVRDVLYCVAHEAGMAVLYTKPAGQVGSRKELFTVHSGARYEVFNNYLVVCPDPFKSKLLLFDLGADYFTLAFTLDTQVYTGDEAVFSSSGEALYRIVSGRIFRTTIHQGRLRDDPVCQATNNQTWFSVSSGPAPWLVMSWRLFNQYLWNIVDPERRQHQVALADLDPGEKLTDQHVLFSETSLVLVRRTQFQGKEHVRWDHIDTSGTILISHRSDLRDAPQFANINGAFYGSGTIRHATDDGLLKEVVTSRQTAVMDSTASFVDGTDSITMLSGSLLVVKQDRVLQLTIRK